MLFINRRGYANCILPFLQEAIKCPHCDVTLTFTGTAA